MRVIGSVLAVAFLVVAPITPARAAEPMPAAIAPVLPEIDTAFAKFQRDSHSPGLVYGIVADGRLVHVKALGVRSEEHTSELQSLMRISYAVFCLKKKQIQPKQLIQH